MINKTLLYFLFIGLTINSIFAVPTVIDNHIKVDQFGYRCNDQKIAVISNPQTGFNSGSPFLPSTATDQYQVRSWTDDAVLYTGTITAWNGGATQSQSGDKVWWFNFSSLSLLAPIIFTMLERMLALIDLKLEMMLIKMS